MGYTHQIFWNEYEAWLDMFVQKSFRTTEDAVKIHVDALKQREYDIAGNQNITNIRVVTI